MSHDIPWAGEWRLTTPLCSTILTNFYLFCNMLTPSEAPSLIEGVTVSLICWNVAGFKPSYQDDIMKYLCDSKADLCFLQEVLNANTDVLLAGLNDIYDMVSLQQEAATTRIRSLNYLIYKSYCAA